MKLKLCAIGAIFLAYMTVTFASGTASSLCETTNLYLCQIFLDGTNPPHAVDIKGKVIPESSAVQPDQPIILAKDSKDRLRFELKPEAAFDHAKHSTNALYSMDGKTVTTCVECHHTAQPSAPKDQEYLKTFDRKEVLTAKQLETSKEAVQSCRACHFQAASEETDEYPPESLTYPKKLKRPPTGKLINEVAYHVNCNSCHDAVRKRDPKLLSPSGCGDCHSKKP